jgi:hypothetical protein
LQQEIRKLQDDIRNSDIDKESKFFLINELRKIEDLILNYRIRGSSGLSKVSEEVSGGELKVIIPGRTLSSRSAIMLRNWKHG